MSTGNNDAVLAVVVIGLPLLAVLWFSHSIGAEFFTTLTTIGYSLAGLAIVGCAWYFMRFSVWTLALLVFVVVWPAWWPVLDSIAAGGKTPDEIQDMSQIYSTWYTHGIFKWGVEIVAGAWLSYCVWSSNNRD